MRYLADCFSMALRYCRDTRLRVLLTVLGIMFGTSALIAVLSIGQGGKMRARNELAAIGTDRIWLNMADDASALLCGGDYDALLRALPAGVHATPLCSTYLRGARGGVSTLVSVTGCADTLPALEEMQMTQGRFLCPYDVQQRQAVAVINRELAQTLFGSGVAVGKEVTLGGHAVTVVGVSDKQTGSAQTCTAYIPYTLLQRWRGSDTIDSISLSVENEQALPQTAYLAREVLQAQTGQRILSTTLQGERDLVQEVMDIFTWVIASVAAVALLVSGIGVMNVMFMSVHARRGEIGLRKALGAQNRQILLQFLLESILLCAFGGVGGTLLGVAMARAAAHLAAIPFLVPPGAVVASLCLTALIGIGFGVAPAMQAAGVAPVIAFKND